MDRSCTNCGADDPGAVPAVRRVRHAAGRRGGAGRGPPVRDGRQLGPEGLHRARRAPRPGDPARGPDPLLRRDAGRLRVPRRHDREDHRRRDRRGLRAAGPPRRRRAACGRGRRRDAARPGHPQRPARRRPGASGWWSGPGRDRRRRVRRGEHRSARPDGRHDGDLVGHGAERAAVRGPARRVDVRPGQRSGRTSRRWRPSPRSGRTEACSRPTGSSRSRRVREAGQSAADTAAAGHAAVRRPAARRTRTPSGTAACAAPSLAHDGRRPRQPQDRDDRVRRSEARGARRASRPSPEALRTS